MGSYGCQVGSLDTHDAMPDAPTRWKDSTDEKTRSRVRGNGGQSGGCPYRFREGRTWCPSGCIRGTGDDARGKERTGAQPKAPHRDPEEGEGSTGREVLDERSKDFYNLYRQRAEVRCNF